MNQKSHLSSAPFEVLLIEDSAGDVRLTWEALKDTKMRISLNVLSDGAEALAHLRREKHHAAASRPDLILLDLNLPKKDGRDVLKEIKESDALKSIPVVILTTSASPLDVEHSYQLHANCYITKPMDLRGFTKVLRSIEEFWLSVVKLPSMSGSSG
jgi:chemotaxis family two-component system response regulator Rcp1